MAKNGVKKNDVEAIAVKLSQNAGSTTEVVVDSESNLLGLFYQDSAMKTAYTSFPEILFVDATQKLNELRMPLYILFGEDGNGESEIVAIFLVANEEGATIRRMVEIFKEHNPTWNKTQTIMSDKDFNEGEVFASEFPEAKLLICLFHTQRTFRREVTTEKMGIRLEERNLCLEILPKMTYAKNVEQYKSLCSELHATKIQSVVDYFEENWHPIHVQWVEGLKATNLTFLNRTNNRIESINQKVKSVCSKFSNLEKFFDELLLAIQSLRDARDHRAIMMQKRPVVPFSAESVKSAYMQSLTPYAFSFVLKQMELADNVKLPEEANLNETVELSSTSSRVKVSQVSCDCSFWTAMKLPCRHIFAVRKAAGVQMFNSNLFTRWRLDYYQSKHHVLKNPGMPLEPASTAVSVGEPSTVKVLSQGQKYKKAFQLCQQLSSVVSEGPMRQFTSHMEILNLLLQSWKDGVEVSVHQVNYDSDTQEHTVDESDGRSELENCHDMAHGALLQATELDGGLENSVSDLEPNNSHPMANGHISLSQVKIPARIPKRGRSKGAELTVIGLPRKKRKTTGTEKKKPTPFLKKMPQEKDKVLLMWLLDPKDVNHALKGGVIDEDLVETRPEKVNPALAGENVNFMRLRRYFSKDAWLLVEDIIKQLKLSNSWICQCCKEELEDAQSIGCDDCLCWFHFTCASWKKPPKSKFWFCCNCYANSK